MDSKPLPSEDSLAYYAKLQQKGFDLKHWEELERRAKIASYEGTHIGDWGFDLMDFRMMINETNLEFNLSEE